MLIKSEFEELIIIPQHIIKGRILTKRNGMFIKSNIL